MSDREDVEKCLLEALSMAPKHERTSDYANSLHMALGVTAETLYGVIKDMIDRGALKYHRAGKVAFIDIAPDAATLAAAAATYRSSREHLLVEALLAADGLPKAEFRRLSGALGMMRPDFDKMVRGMIDRGVLREERRGSQVITEFDAW